MGCSSSDPEPPPDPLATEAGFCTELAKVICNDNVVTSCYGSVASSVEADKEVCLEQAEANFCNSNNLVYRAGEAQTCIDAYASAYSDAALEVDELKAIDEACHKNLSGSGAEGDECAADAECNGAEELRCVAKPGAQGTCQVPEEVSPGLDCAAAAQTCEEGFYCSTEAEACIARQSAGEDCSETQPCDAESLCVDAVCEAKVSNGSECTQNEECAGGFCDITQGNLDGRCKAALPVVDSNGQCENLLP